FNDVHWGKGVPQAILKTATFNPSRYLGDVRKGRTLNHVSITSALIREAVKDPVGTARDLQTQYAKHLTQHDQSWLWGFIGYRAALAWNRNSDGYFDQANLDLLGPDHREWRVRAALLTGDLSKSAKLIEDLPEQLKSKETWQYWQARGLAATGEIENARKTWAKIGQPFSFYGKLSLEELGASVAAPSRPRPPTAAELLKAKENDGLARSLAFYEAGMNYEGYREFNLQTEQMNDRELLAAATWANDNRLYDRAIAAADRTQQEHDATLRYLTPFQQNMFAKARETGVDPAWVYGVIRQESRFITIARSHVGANGLMQVMPGTAKYVARKIGMKDFRLSEVNQIDTNLTLGTNYLRIVAEGLDNSMVMASAGYNAGPSRPRTWRSRLGEGVSMEGALFAELIPFDETRSYVKNVLSNTVVYSQLLNNESGSLKQRLGIIKGSN
ncbi:MAG: transglycosylase SLT domain-containing protein, partial [Limnobacter sp.]|nr:transglycosylase SLT domain-containing protein [Limnobacter sp.]